MERPDQASLQQLSDDLRTWARDLPGTGSELYGRICAGLADDPERAAIILSARPGFRNPLVLLAAVHHRLLSGERHALAGYYATVSGEPARPPDDGLYPAFGAFFDEHRVRLEALVASRTTQTNEPRRTVVTLPALGLVQERSGVPLALLEVGASAGLNLVPDRYAFRIGQVRAGDPGSAVLLECEALGELRPPVPERIRVDWRLGLDLNPMDVRDPETLAWLRALVWPEQPERLALLDAAIGVARHDPPLVVRGDLVDDIPPLVAEAPREAALAVVTTWTLAYLEADRRHAFLETLRGQASAARRSIWLVAGEAESVVASLGLGLVEMPEEGYGRSTLSLHRFEPDGQSEHVLLARTHAHGRWIRWLDPATAAGAA